MYEDFEETNIVEEIGNIANPRNYNNRGFQPSYKFGIEAGPNIRLPHPDCLMIKELDKGVLDKMSGLVDYSFYETLHEG